MRTRDFGNPLRRQFLASHSDYLHCHISTSKGQIGSHRHLRSCPRPIHQGRTLKQHGTTKVEVFVEKRVRGRAQTAGANSRRGATKKREISRTLFGAPPFFSINLHFLVHTEFKSYTLPGALSESLFRRSVSTADRSYFREVTVS